MPANEVRETRNTCRILVRKPDATVLLETYRNRREDYIKIDLRRTVFEDVNWIEAAQDRILNNIAIP